MMNVFDEEAEMAFVEDMEMLVLLIEAQLTPDEIRVWSSFTGAVN